MMHPLGHALGQAEERERKLRDVQRPAQVGDWSWNLAEESIRWSGQTCHLFGLPAAGAG